MFDVGKCYSRMFGCVGMLGLWSNHRDLEPMLEWDCALPPPPLPPVLLKMSNRKVEPERGCWEKRGFGCGHGCWTMGPGYDACGRGHGCWTTSPELERKSNRR